MWPERRAGHCVKATVEHLVEAFSPRECQRLVLIEDGMSPVAGFAAQQREFLVAMKSLGARTLSTKEVAEELLAARPANEGNANGCQ